MHRLHSDLTYSWRYGDYVRDVRLIYVIIGKMGNLSAIWLGAEQLGMKFMTLFHQRHGALHLVLLRVILQSFR
jgi:hypothetical protein